MIAREAAGGGSPQQVRDLAQTLVAAGEVVLERGFLGGRQSVQDVRADGQVGFLLGRHGSSSRHARSCRSPARIRDFTVPSGVDSASATST